MSRISFNVSEDDNQQTLAYQQMEIAKNCLRKRFPKYSLKEINSVLSKTNKSKNKQKQNAQLQKQFDNLQAFGEKLLQKFQENEINISNRKHNYNKNSKDFHYNYNDNLKCNKRSSHFGEQNDKHEEQRIIAKIFCQSGVNFPIAKSFFPKMTPKAYRSHVEIINNQTINEIEKFLRYECNIQIEKLNRDQKRSMRTQMVKIREWLGNTDINQLQTYYKFIQRNFQQKSIDIEQKDAIKLYKTILQIVKGPFVDVLEDDDGNEKMQYDELEGHHCTKQQQKAIIILYNKYKCIDKVSNALCENYGYNIKWSKHSLGLVFKSILNYSLKKLILSVQKYASEKLRFLFDCSNQNINLLLKTQNFIDLKIKLFNFYLKKKININELIDITKHINKFSITQNYINNQKDLINQMQIPKLEGQQTKMEVQNGGIVKFEEIQKKQEIISNQIKYEQIKSNTNEKKEEQNIKHLSIKKKERKGKTIQFSNVNKQLIEQIQN